MGILDSNTRGAAVYHTGSSGCHAQPGPLPRPRGHGIGAHDVLPDTPWLCPNVPSATYRVPRAECLLRFGPEDSERISLGPELLVLGDMGWLCFQMKE